MFTLTVGMPRKVAPEPPEDDAAGVEGSEGSGAGDCDGGCTVPVCSAEFGEALIV